MSKIIYALSLTMQTHSGAPQGPGWYLIGHANDGNDGRNLQRKVTLTQAEEIARAFEETISPGDETVSVHPFEIVKTGTLKAVDAIQKELEQAEAAASKLGSLRKTLKDFGDMR